MAPPPLPISNTSPVGWKPCSAQGMINRRANAAYIRPVQKFFSNLDISVMNGEPSTLGHNLTPGQHRDPPSIPSQPEKGRDVRQHERLEDVQAGRRSDAA